MSRVLVPLLLTIPQQYLRRLYSVSASRWFLCRKRRPTLSGMRSYASSKVGMPISVRSHCIARPHALPAKTRVFVDFLGAFRRDRSAEHFAGSLDSSDCLCVPHCASRQPRWRHPPSPTTLSNKDVGCVAIVGNCAHRLKTAASQPFVGRCGSADAICSRRVFQPSTQSRRPRETARAPSLGWTRHRSIPVQHNPANVHGSSYVVPPDKWPCAGRPSLPLNTALHNPL
jgi:hypothetical protein